MRSRAWLVNHLAAKAVARVIFASWAEQVQKTEFRLEMKVATRFASLNAGEIDELVVNKDSSNTKKATKVAVELFRKYLAKKNKQEDFLSSTEDKLNKNLQQFYVEARKMDRTEYSKSSLIAIRFALCRYIKASRPELDIVNGSSFDKANRVFKAKIVDLKKKGKAKVEHKPAIAVQDLRKLYFSEAFNTSMPTGLQNKVFFEIMLYFCRRGRENLRELTKDSFAVCSLQFLCKDTNVSLATFVSQNE